jgi:predicted aspartyl protease
MTSRRTSLSRREILVAALVTSCAHPRPAPIEMNPSDTLVLPLTFIEGLPQIDVAVGNTHLTLIVDTGAYAAIALSPPTLARLAGVTYTGDARKFSDARGDVHTAKEFVLDEIALGTLRVHDVAGQELVFANDYAPPNRDGYVGRPLFVRHRLLVDYAARTLTMLSGATQSMETSFRARAPAVLAIEDVGLVVDAVLDGVSRRFVVDTAATHSMLRADAAGEQRATTRTLAIAGVTLDAFDVVEMDGGPPGVDGILGRNLFEGRRVLMDLPGGRLWMGDG